MLVCSRKSLKEINLNLNGGSYLLNILSTVFTLINSATFATPV